MRPFTQHQGIACPLALANIDTDQLIPARFMARPRAAGYGECLLHALRFGEDGTADPNFPLNQGRFAGASLLVSRRNFGSGSSREAAVYALMDFGIRAVIAPSFGDIFAANAVNNGLLPALVSEEAAESLLDFLADAEMPLVAVDLEALTLRAGATTFAVVLDPVWRTKLLNGWDDLDLTDSYAEAIARFRAKDRQSRPWTAPDHPSAAPARASSQASISPRSAENK